jgi:hypothetical protein
MTNRDNIRRLVEQITVDLAQVRYISNQRDLHAEDVQVLSDLAESALTELSVFDANAAVADEAAQVKALHDRVHVIVVQLRVLRNTLESMENAAEKALEDVRRISASLEESAPEDEAL